MCVCVGECVGVSVGLCLCVGMCVGVGGGGGGIVWVWVCEYVYASICSMGTVFILVV